MTSILQALKEKVFPATTSIKFEDVVVNPTPEQKASRNFSRMVRLQQALAELKLDDPARAELEKELRIKELEVQLQTLKGGK